MSTQKQHGTKLLMCFIALTLLFSPVGLLAAPYYQGKRIKLIVGFGPGGGYDRMARLLAKYLPKYIPGKPGIIIENMGGAGSMIAANYLYNIAKPDGLNILSVERGLPFAQLLKADGVRFDFTKYSWIGSVSVETMVLCLRSDLPYKTFEDLKKAKAPIMIGCTGSSDSNAQFPILLNAFLGINLKLITYPSTNEVMLAVERREVDGRGATYSTIRPDIERGVVRPFIRGRVTEPELKYLPADEDLTTDPKGKMMLAIRSSTDRVGRPYIAPPKTPPEIMKILRDAFANLANDQELKEESKRVMMPVQYVPADECLKTYNFVFNQPSDIINELSKHIKF